MAQQQPRRDQELGNAKSGKIRSGGEEDYAERWRDEFGRAAAMDPAAPYAYYGAAVGAVEAGGYGAPPPPPPPGITTVADYGAATGSGLYPTTAAPYGMDPFAAGAGYGTTTGAAYGTGGVGAGSQWGGGGGDNRAENRRNRDDKDMNRDNRDQK